MDGSVSGKLTNRREFDLGQSAILKARTSINPVISVSNISMRFGAKILFEEVSTAFLSGRCYGLSGPNGSGKSTFMKLLTGEMDAQKGTVVRPKRLGVLPADSYASAAEVFRQKYPYNPGRGIQSWLTTNWSKIN